MRHDASLLLKWYDHNARDLPWRVPPAQSKVGVLPDPYHVWLSEVMLQQTTVATVGAYFQKFIHRWPKMEDMAAAQDQEVMAAWAGLGYYARARNMLAAARVVTRNYSGCFPQSEAELRKLPGIGPYTAAAIRAFAFGKRAVVVDGNIERVFSRLYAIKTPLPDAKPEIYDHVDQATPMERAGDFAQALMDLGATICTPKNPACGLCPWRQNCAAHEMGDMLAYPKKRPKPVKPTKRGIAYVARRFDGALLLEVRPAKGLLGGMLGWPTTEWTEEMPNPNPPMAADWQVLETQVRHSFTHFHLILDVAIAQVDAKTPTKTGTFHAPDAFDPSHLATLMRKVYSLAQPSSTPKPTKARA